MSPCIQTFDDPVIIRIKPKLYKIFKTLHDLTAHHNHHLLFSFSNLSAIIIFVKYIISISLNFHIFLFFPLLLVLFLFFFFVFFCPKENLPLCRKLALFYVFVHCVFSELTLSFTTPNHLYLNGIFFLEGTDFKLENIEMGLVLGSFFPQGWHSSNTQKMLCKHLLNS